MGDVPKKRTVQDLRKRSLPAVRFEELVELASREDLNPHQVATQASVRGWRSRQVRAVRFLRILHRDYGLEALEAFVLETTMERAHTGDRDRACSGGKKRE